MKVFVGVTERNFLYIVLLIKEMDCPAEHGYMPALKKEMKLSGSKSYPYSYRELN